MTLPIQALINQEQLDAVMQPIAEARGMPNATYTSMEAFQFERDHLFAPHWAAIGFQDSLQNGEARPVDFMGIPLLLTRDRAGEVRVFHNVCSHRGMQLVDSPRKTNGLLVCPYHSWTYALSGELKATPHIGGVGVHQAEGFQCDGRGLREVRSHTWMGIVMINLDGNAAPFEEANATILQRYRKLMGDSGESSLRLALTHAGATLEVNCNWKLALENYLEAYHLPFIHPGLNSYSPLEKHSNEIISDNSAGQVTGTFDPGLDRDDPLPLFPDWDKERLATGEYPVLFPNLGLGFQANHVFAFIVHPISPGVCREELKIFYATDEANEDRYLQQRKANLDAWSVVFNEDVEPCERMQTGRNSPGYEGGAFSPFHDNCSLHFHQWVAQQYRQGLSRDTNG